MSSHRKLVISTIFSAAPGDAGLVDASQFPRSFEVTVADQAALDALKAALPATGIDNVVLERPFNLSS